MTRAARMGAMFALVAIGVSTCAVWLATQPEPSLSRTPIAEASGASGTPTPSPTPSPSPTLSEWEVALAVAQGLPLEVAAGHVIMPDISSASPRAAAELVRSRHLAGLIVMGGGITDEAGVKALTAAIASADPERPWPVMIATDEEGGVVQRLRPLLGYVSAFMAAGANGESGEIRDYYAGLGAQMAELGFTMDMAPVADVTIGLKDPTIRTRSAGSDPAAVAEVVGAAWHGLEDGGVTPVLKHFPGHGSVRTDSHTGLPVQSASIATLESRDLVPFASAVADGAPAVMVGHIRVKAWGNAPASVNPRAYAYLREELAFDGLVMTDAMNMGAITERYGPGKAAALAIGAGADLVVMPANLDKAIAGIEQAVMNGTLPRERLDEAVARVAMAAMAQARLVSNVEPERPTAFVEGSIVVASARCDALIGDAVHVTGGTPGQRTALATALRAEGVRVGSKGTVIALVAGDRGHAKADVVVALGGPWGLPKSTAKTYVATWGGGGEQLRALAKVLTGEVAPRGTWPVKLRLPYSVCS